MYALLWRISSAPAAANCSSHRSSVAISETLPAMARSASLRCLSARL